MKIQYENNQKLVRVNKFMDSLPYFSHREIKYQNSEGKSVK